MANFQLGIFESYKTDTGDLVIIDVRISPQLNLNVYVRSERLTIPEFDGREKMTMLPVFL